MDDPLLDEKKPKRPRNQVYVIADLHLGHAKVAEYRGFPTVDAHDDALVQAWNRTVRMRDVVYVLGDVFRLDRLPELLGTKKLALGNHDKKPCGDYTRHFSQVRACFEFDGCLLTHIPVHSSQFNRYELNVHGHTHAGFVDDARYVSTSVENCPEMQPMLLRDLIQARREVLARCAPNTTACRGCGAVIDPDICGCGTHRDFHGMFDTHSFIPAGCNCYRDRK